jgi:hypothetical protein
MQLTVRHKVQLNDISLSGALLASGFTLPVGTEAQLHTGFGTGPFKANLRVVRQAGAPADQTSLAFGAMFTSMDAVSRRSLELFLRRASL